MKTLSMNDGSYTDSCNGSESASCDPELDAEAIRIGDTKNICSFTVAVRIREGAACV